MPNLEIIFTNDSGIDYLRPFLIDILLEGGMNLQSIILISLEN